MSGRRPQFASFFFIPSAFPLLQSDIFRYLLRIMSGQPVKFSYGLFERITRQQNRGCSRKRESKRVRTVQDRKKLNKSIFLFTTVGGGHPR